MTELRQNLITRDWVIIATERAKRPDEFTQGETHKNQNLPAYQPECPFCLGNEHLTGSQEYLCHHLNPIATLSADDESSMRPYPRTAILLLVL